MKRTLTKLFIVSAMLLTAGLSWGSELYVEGATSTLQWKLYVVDTVSGALIKSVDQTGPFFLGGFNGNGNLQGIRWNPDISQEEFGVIDTSTGVFTVTGTVGDLATWSGQTAIRGNTLYVFGSNSTSQPKLYVLDTVSGALTSSVNLTDQFFAGGFDGNGNLQGIRWNASISKEEFGVIDTSTGVFTLTGTVGDLATWSGQTAIRGNTLYVFGSNSTSQPKLYVLDTVSGALTSSVNLTDQFFGGGFDGNGNLQGIRWNASISKEEFGVINTTTGVFTVTGTVGDLAFWSGQTAIRNVSDLTITKSHKGNFSQGQTGASYTIKVTNVGSASTTGTVTVTDNLPAALTATAISGSGWNCNQGAVTCTRSNSLAAGLAYPPITVFVKVASNAPGSVTNTATVSGGGQANISNDMASDPTTVIPVIPDLTVSKTHNGNFKKGQTGAKYSINVKNSGTGPTTGTVTVSDALPAGLTATAISGGSSWNCSLDTLTCTTNNVLAAGSSFPTITVTVSVAGNAPSTVTNIATVSGGGENNTSNDSASNVTTIK